MAGNRLLFVIVFAAADFFGFFAAALGIAWLLTGRAVLPTGFPHNLAEAVTVTVGGVAVSLWASKRMLQRLRETKEVSPS